MKKLLIIVSISALMLSGGTVSASKHETISEVFIIQSVSNGEIRGDIIKGEEDQGEGIYLLQKDINIKIVKGDKIKVTYDKDDYENDIWDNILKVERV